MSVLAYALCAETDIEYQLGITITGNDVTVIENMIDAATIWIENYCGRHIIKHGANATEYFDIDYKTNEIFLRNTPIDSITSVGEDPDADTPPDALVLDTDYYKDDATGILLRNNTHWFRGSGFRSVKVIYEGGYETAPSDVKQACIEIVCALWLARQRGDVTAERVGQVSQQYATPDSGVVGIIATKPYIMDLLHAYKTNFM